MSIASVDDQLFNSNESEEELNLSGTLEGILKDSPPPKVTSLKSNNYICTGDKCKLHIDEVDSSLKNIDKRIDSDNSASDKYRPDDDEGSNTDAEKTDKSARVKIGLTTGDF